MFVYFLFLLFRFLLPSMDKNINEILSLREDLLSKNLSISYNPRPLKIIKGYMQVCIEIIDF